MTEPTDYSTWTYDEHLAQAERLAAAADAAASSERPPSQAAQQRESILQIAARGELHGTLARLKKPTETPKPTSRQAKVSAD